MSVVFHPEACHIKWKEKNFFEGWYFKHTNNEEAICFIPGIVINDNEKKAFIQVITNESSEYFEYEYSEFSYGCNPFWVKINNNFFSMDKIEINMPKIKGKIEYFNKIKIEKNMYMPNIMGPFAYCSSMECNHGVLSLYHSTKGSISYNAKTISLENGRGYIEKDWGKSFPKKYIWIQANDFGKTNTSLFFSYAKVPYKGLRFNGHVCIFLLDGKEYRFATYNFSKINVGAGLASALNEQKIILKKRKFKIRN